MKFSTAFSVAITTAFAPSLVSAANISISVGATGLVGFVVVKAKLLADRLLYPQVFTPQQVTAQRGDLVLFEFRGGNHVCFLRSPRTRSMSHPSHRPSPKVPSPTHAHASRHLSAPVESLI